jgi:hypothetical protein
MLWTSEQRIDQDEISDVRRFVRFICPPAIQAATNKMSCNFDPKSSTHIGTNRAIERTRNRRRGARRIRSPVLQGCSFRNSRRRSSFAALGVGNKLQERPIWIPKIDRDTVALRAESPHGSEFYLDAVHLQVFRRTADGSGPFEAEIASP